MTLRLDTPVQFLKGVGPKLAEVMRAKGVAVVQDLLEWYPRAYEDRRAARSVASLRPDELVSLKARVVRVSSFNMGQSRRKIYDVTVSDGTGKVHCKFFRVPYKGYFERFQPNQEVRVVGKVTHYRGMIEFHHPDIQDIEADAVEDDAILPIYPETEGLTNRQIKKLVGQALAELRPLDEAFRAADGRQKADFIRLAAAAAAPFAGQGNARNGRASAQAKSDAELAGFARALEPIDRFPAWLRSEKRLPGRFESLAMVHNPPRDAGPDFADLKTPWHRRLIFEEFFWLELYLASRKAGLQREAAPAFAPDFALVDRLREQLPFHLTGAQERAFAQIAADLRKPHPMHRLVQGDVGSGKTLVAFMAAAFAAQSGFQTAIMAPTEILSEQHAKNAARFLAPIGVDVGLLTGSTRASERAQTLELLKRGAVKVVVGTHALIEDEVEFNKLGLVVIDEQHRFGVHQRSRLKRKGPSPHFLVMTATPIPRTLAMTVYGDLDVSVIDELPPGRSPVQTRVGFENVRPKMMAFLKEQLEKGRQAYVVYPLVEESEKIDLKDAVSAAEELQAQLPGHRIGLLHGKMKPAEKDAAMAKFRAGELHVLVSTTVIEVGVDVPNATLMVIEHAERFGLSQLHQLRGRVGRGAHKSFCILMLGKAVSDESRARAKIMEQTTDGFKIAEADLEIRGPGEFLGVRQSGLPGFKLANIVRDAQILQEARDAAFEILERDPRLTKPEHHWLRAELVKAHGPAALASVG